MLWLGVAAILLWVPPPGAAHRYKISPKPCSVNGVDGTCMFVWECIKTEGTHVGMCVDAFMFGSCCSHNTSQNAVAGEPDVLFSPPSHATAPTFTARPPAPTTIIDNVMESSALVSSWTPAHTAPSSTWQATTEPGFVTRPKPRPWPTRRPIITTKLTTKPTTKISFKPVVTSTTSTSTTTTTTTSTTTTTTSVPPPPPSTTTTTSTTTTQAPTTSSSLLPTTTIFSEAVTASLSASNTHSTIQCGVAPLFPRPEMRIVGGRNAPFGGWPWQVSVRRTSFFGFSSTHRCGGAVLNENWIATAGHCVDDLLTSQIRIRVGEYDFSSVQEPYPFVERGVGRKVVHPKYNFFTYEYDLALVRLESPLEFAPHIAPICLPGSDDLLIGENATVTGWGRLSEGGTLPSVLQEVSVPIVSNDCCKSMFLRAGRHEFIPEIFLCAGHENGGQDSCQGDSGGPLQVRGRDGRYFLAGIISWGIGCAEANLPGVCTRISKFVPWILETVT
ncbi:Serine proteinase stubble [Blattella germanica]|nr:Serine proteinase stubble [Blattella germanica]